MSSGGFAGTTTIRLIRESYVVKRYDKNGRMYFQRKVKKIKWGDVARFKLKKIGKSSGESLEYCFFLADKYGVDFLNRVVGYRTHKPTHEFPFVVSFYEKR